MEVLRALPEEGGGRDCVLIVGRKHLGTVYHGRGTVLFGHTGEGDRSKDCWESEERRVLFG